MYDECDETPAELAVMALLPSGAHLANIAPAIPGVEDPTHLVPIFVGPGHFDGRDGLGITIRGCTYDQGRQTVARLVGRLVGLGLARPAIIWQGGRFIVDANMIGWSIAGTGDFDDELVSTLTGLIADTRPKAVCFVVRVSYG